MEYLGIFWNKDIEKNRIYVQALAVSEGKYYCFEKAEGQYELRDSRVFDPADRFKQVAPKELARW